MSSSLPVEKTYTNKNTFILESDVILKKTRKQKDKMEFIVSENIFRQREPDI